MVASDGDSQRQQHRQEPRVLVGVPERSLHSPHALAAEDESLGAEDSLEMLDDPVNGGDQEGTEGTGDHHQQLVARAASVENRDEQGTRGEQQKDVRDRLGWLEPLKARDQGGADQQHDADEDRWQLAAIRALEEGAVDEHAEDDQRKQELERLARQADVGAERLADLEPGERRYRHCQRQPILRPADHGEHDRPRPARQRATAGG